MSYCGRFAPSPTGPLHFGSLVTAVASFLEARCHGGRWLLRMEDLDQPREQPGAAEAIIGTLRCFGLYWDGPILYQSERHDAYGAALAQLQREGVVYRCACSRTDIAAALAQPGVALDSNAVPIYPGTCRNGISGERPARALRVLTDDTEIVFEDLVQGKLRQRLASDVGDFVVRRADGPFAYQLAVVLDDAAQGITDVVRGYDLWESTPRQIYLQRLLGLPTPEYAHLPLAVDSGERKLSKQSGAPAVDCAHAATELWRALDFLGQAPEPGLARATLREIWRWALLHWDVQRVPRRRTIPVNINTRTP